VYDLLRPIIARDGKDPTMLQKMMIASAGGILPEFISIHRFVS